MIMTLSIRLSPLGEHINVADADQLVLLSVEAFDRYNLRGEVLMKKQKTWSRTEAAAAAAVADKQMPRCREEKKERLMLFP